MKLQEEKELEKILRPLGGWNADIVHQQGRSKKSYSLYKYEPIYDGVKKAISSYFNISDAKLFDNAFKQAVTGDGNELLRIATLHSSALLPLLTFYKVSESNPIIIAGHTFDRVFFEVKNKVFKGPSNVDVVLYSTKDKYLLFIESKFTELLDTSLPEISSAYDKWLIKASLVQNKDGSWSKEGFGDLYYYGIKQMVSHFIGLLKGPVEKDERSIGTPRGKYKDLYESAKKLILSSIIYDDTINRFFYKEEQNLVTCYKELYRACMAELRKFSAEDCKQLGVPSENITRIEILPEILTYQEVFEQNRNLLDHNVKLFYGFGK